jgi:hypothetical protein
MVNGIPYRWRVRKKPTYHQGLEWSGLLLAVEHATQPGNSLVVELLQPHPSSWMLSEATPVLPSDVARYIEAATQIGWQPTQPGKTFVLKASGTI